MSCLDNIVTVRGFCGDVEPSSGYYINDLPGITLSKAADVADEEVVTGVGVLNRSVTNALALFKSDLILKMLGVVKFGAILESKLASKFSDDYLALDPSERGVEVELCSNCRLVQMVIPYVNVKSDTTKTGAILKLVDGSTTETFTFDLVAGVTTLVPTNYLVTSDKVTVTVDNVDIAVNDSDIKNSCCLCGCEDCGCDFAGFTVTGVGADTNKSYGIQPLVNVVCSEDRFLCEILRYIGKALWFKSGVMFINELEVTGRINDFTVYGVEEAVAKAAEWEEAYQDELTLLVQRLPEYFSESDNCCFVCNASGWAWSIP